MRCGYSPAKILFLSEHATFTQPYSRELIERTMRTFYTRFFRQQFKRSCVPDGPKVGTVSLSPRGDWRMPSDADPAGMAAVGVGEVRAKEELLKKLQAEAQTMQNEAGTRVLDLQYLRRLEDFTGGTLVNLTREGRLDSQAILSLSKFIMETRGEKSKIRDRASAEAAGQHQGGRARQETDRPSSRPGRGGSSTTR